MATNTAFRSTRRVYSAEQLHRLRNTQSQPKLSEAIERHESEDAELVKEHVLKPSKSFGARSFKGRQHTASSLRVPSTASHTENSSVSSYDALPLPAPNAPLQPQALGDVAANAVAKFKPGRSPTPSLKRAAVEAFKEKHGSPHHVRVTAGGRIVTAEQSPLCQPRYGYSAIKINGSLIKFAPNQRFSNRPGETEPASGQQGSIVEDEAGNFFQIVGNKILPLHTRADGFMELHMAAANLNGPQQRIQSQGHNMPPSRASGHVLGPTIKNSDVVPEPSIEMQITALKARRQKYEDEQKQINQQEAKYGRQMEHHDRKMMLSRRRYLVTESDILRKRIKDLESRLPQNGTTSPRGRPSVSASGFGRGNTQQFLQGQSFNGGAPHQYVPMLNGPPPNFASQLGATPSPDEEFNGNIWAASAANMFMPPPFDGAMAAPLAILQSMPFPGPPVPMQNTIPQVDGARSLVDHRLESPDHSHAVSIKAPDGKTGIKSGLNPMSPAYKPGMAAGKNVAAPVVQRRVATPLSPMHKLATPVPDAVESSNATDEIVSPTKRDNLPHSSSIGSFRTADFFPGNPREHSARQHAYAQSYDKGNEQEEEDADAITPVRDTWKTSAPDTGNDNAPVAPPGTPIFYSAPTTHAPQPAKAESNNMHHVDMDVADREAHNISPKNRHDFVFIQEDPGRLANCTVSTPPEDTSSQSSGLVVNVEGKSNEWMLGFAEGLRHVSPPFAKLSVLDWLEGYSAGVTASIRPRTTSPNPKLKMDAGLTAALSKPAPVENPVIAILNRIDRDNAASLAAMSITGSPMKAQSRRPSPAMASRSSSRLQAVESASGLTRSPFESSTKSVDCLKQAILAPQNENAILTPAANGLHVTEANYLCRGWNKKPHNPPSMELPGLGLVPQHSDTTARQDNVSEDNDVESKLAVDHTSETRPALQSNLSTARITSGSVGIGGGIPTPFNNRITSIDSSMLGQWPGNRVKTPSEWRSAGASQGLTAGTGFFAHSQFDGTDDATAPSGSTPQLTTGVSGAPQRITSDTHARLSSGGRFREGSIDRITSPPNSPRPMSPANSPYGTPVRRDSRKNSPRKGPSPTKVIGNLAEKVGIKVTSPTPSEMGDEQTSPSGKRHWGGVRDWMKSSKGNNV